MTKDHFMKIGVPELLVRLEMAQGTREGRRLVEMGAVFINERRLKDPEKCVKIETGDVVRVARRRKVVAIRLEGEDLGPKPAPKAASGNGYVRPFRPSFGNCVATGCTAVSGEAGFEV